MIGKIAFALGIVVFLAATVAAALQAAMHSGITPAQTQTFLQQALEMGKQLWLPEAFALGFVLIGGGILLIAKQKDETP